MTTQDHLRFQCDDAGNQLRRVFDGFPEGALDALTDPFSMSPRQMMIHLGEAYRATVAGARGEPYEWGSYEPASRTTDALSEEVWNLRAQAVDAVIAQGDSGVKNATMFILAHDYYHVGQLCLLRSAAQPDWDPYSIYS